MKVFLWTGNLISLEDMITVENKTRRNPNCSTRRVNVRLKLFASRRKWCLYVCLKGRKNLIWHILSAINVRLMALCLEELKEHPFTFTNNRLKSPRHVQLFDNLIFPLFVRTPKTATNIFQHPQIHISMGLSKNFKEKQKTVFEKY